MEGEDKCNENAAGNLSIDTNFLSLSVVVYRETLGLIIELHQDGLMKDAEQERWCLCKKMVK